MIGELIAQNLPVQIWRKTGGFVLRRDPSQCGACCSMQRCGQTLRKELDHACGKHSLACPHGMLHFCSIIGHLQASGTPLMLIGGTPDAVIRLTPFYVELAVLATLVLVHCSHRAVTFQPVRLESYAAMYAKKIFCFRIIRPFLSSSFSICGCNIDSVQNFVTRVWVTERSVKYF